MNEKIPNVNNPEIRALVLRNHKPREEWFYGAKGSTVIVSCRNCQMDWPCPSITAARDIEDQ